MKIVLSTTNSTFFWLLTLCSFIVVSDPAYATSMTPDERFGAAICSLAMVAQGPAGRGIATLAVIILGISTHFGRVSWSKTLIIAVGIVTVYGAGFVVDAISGDSPLCNGQSFCEYMSSLHNGTTFSCM